MKQQHEKVVVFYLNDQPFCQLDELPIIEQERLAERLVKWEEKVWNAAYGYLLQEEDPEQKLEVTIQFQGALPLEE